MTSHPRQSDIELAEYLEGHPDGDASMDAAASRLRDRDVSASIFDSLKANVLLIESHIDKHPDVAKRMCDVLVEMLAEIRREATDTENPAGRTHETSQGSVNTPTVITSPVAQLRYADMLERHGFLADAEWIRAHVAGEDSA